MAEVFNKMDCNADNSSKCRMAGRNRAAMCRAAGVRCESASYSGAENNKPSINKSSTSSFSGPGFDSAPTSTPAPDFKLKVGYMALPGRAREMEDAVSVKPWFVRPFGGAPLHFAVVFDGHGGTHVSA